MLSLLQIQNGRQSFPHLELLIYVYMMPLKSVLKRQLILQYNGYSLESSVGFFLSVIILRKFISKLMIVVPFVRMKVRLYTPCIFYV